jgi:hypothetical protein
VAKDGPMQMTQKIQILMESQEVNYTIYIVDPA